MRSHSVIEARLKFSPRESRLDVRQKNTLLLLISTFSGPPCGEYIETMEVSVDDPHTTPPDDSGDVRSRAYTYYMYTYTHTRPACRPEKERDTTKWRATGVWTLRAVKVVAYFTSWLRETFSSCRSCVHARTESGGALNRIYCRPIVIPCPRLFRVDEILKTGADGCIHLRDSYDLLIKDV